MSKVLYTGYYTTSSHITPNKIVAYSELTNTTDNDYNYPCSCCGMTYQAGDSVKEIRGAKRGIRLQLDRPNDGDKVVEFKHSKVIHKQVKTRNGTHLVVVKVANG